MNFIILNLILLMHNTFYVRCVYSFYYHPNYLNNEKLIPSVTITDSKLRLQIHAEIIIKTHYHYRFAI